MFVMENGRCLHSAAAETRNASSKPGTSAWEDAALLLLWLEEAQPHVLGHPGAFPGIPQPRVPECPRAAWLWVCGAHGAGMCCWMIWVALLKPGPGPPTASSSAEAVPTSPAGFARSLDTLKVHGAINTRAQGCHGPAGAGGLLKPNGLSLQLTLCGHKSPLCALKKRNPPIRNVSKARREQQTPSVG